MDVQYCGQLNPRIIGRYLLPKNARITGLLR